MYGKKQVYVVIYSICGGVPKRLKGLAWKASRSLDAGVQIPSPPPFILKVCKT